MMPYLHRQVEWQLGPAAGVLAAGLIAGITWSACSGDGRLAQGLASPPASPGGAIVSTPHPANTAGPTSGPEAQVAIDAALREASAVLGVPREHLSVSRIEAREWRDSSLGCPRPGQFYAQVITPGYLVVVSGAGRQMEVHTDLRGHAMVCS
jgi:hypothetical protein